MSCNGFCFQDVEYAFYDESQAQARRWVLGPRLAAFICQRTDQLRSGQEYVFRLARNSPILTSAYQTVKRIIERDFAHPHSAPLQLRVTRRGQTASFRYQTHGRGNTWTRVPSLRYHASTPRLAHGHQSFPGFQPPVSTLPRTPAPSSRRPPSVGGSLYNDSPSASTVSVPSQVASNSPTNEAEATAEDDTIILSPPSSPSVPASTASPWMGEVPALRLRGVTYNVENEVVDLPAASAHTLATPSADDTVDEWAASNRIPADGPPSQGSTSDESLELGDDQDSMDKKDSSDNDPSLAVSSSNLCEWDYLMFLFTPQFFRTS